jgi:hypothetical protein
VPARVSPQRLGGHRRLEAGQERRSKEGAHGCGPRSLEKPGGSPEQARKARARALLAQKIWRCYRRSNNLRVADETGGGVPHRIRSFV